MYKTRNFFLILAVQSEVYFSRWLPPPCGISTSCISQGAQLYVRQPFEAITWTSPGLIDPLFELLWVKVHQEHDATFFSALYHLPAPLYVSADLLDLVETGLPSILREFPEAHVVVAGGLKMLPESEVIARTGLSPVDFQPTRGNNQIYVSDQQYSSVKVVKSPVESDHVAIVAYADGVVPSVGQDETGVFVHQAHMHTCLACSLLCQYYGAGALRQPRWWPARGMWPFVHHALRPSGYLLPTTFRHSHLQNPPYITPTVKCMLRRKYHLMRGGKTEEVATWQWWSSLSSNHIPGPNCAKLICWLTPNHKGIRSDNLLGAPSSQAMLAKVMQSLQSHWTIIMPPFPVMLAAPLRESIVLWIARMSALSSQNGRCLIFSIRSVQLPQV